MVSGGCQCGAIRYEAKGEAAHNALCHCRDCQLSAGAPVVGWIAFREEQLRLVSGTPATYVGKTGSQRQFCPACGTGLFFRNQAMLPGIVDIQTATLDDPAAAPPEAQIQLAEEIPWMEELAALPRFDRFPGG